jgi:hypothetical protein
MAFVSLRRKWLIIPATAVIFSIVFDIYPQTGIFPAAINSSDRARRYRSE